MQIEIHFTWIRERERERERKREREKERERKILMKLWIQSNLWTGEKAACGEKRITQCADKEIYSVFVHPDRVDGLRKVVK